MPALSQWSRRRLGAEHLHAREHFDIAWVSSDAGLLNACRTVAGIETCPLALEIAFGGLLVAHAALERVCVLRTKRLGRSTRRLDVEPRDLFGRHDRGGSGNEERCEKRP
jgi:hypothetical protein